MDIPSENPHALRFGAFEFDPRSGDLRRHGLRIRLAAQPLAILKTLVDRHGEAVTRDELRRVLWTSDTFVDFEVGLNSAVRKLREALDDSAESPRFIETLPRLGYRFIAPVAAARAGVETAPLDGDPQSFPVSESVPGAGHEQLRGAIGKWWAAARASSPRIVWSAGFMLLTVAVAAGVLWQGRPSTGPPATAVEVAGVAGSSARTPQSIDERAHKAYVRGLTARAEQDGLSRAVSYFEEAVAVQPDFAEAYGLLALVQVQFLYGGPFSPHQTVPKAEAAARKALQLNERLGHAHWALGQILALYYWRWEESANALKRAADLLGEDELSLALGESLIRTRHFTEAVALAERARKLDPRSVNAQVAVALAYRAGRAARSCGRRIARSTGSRPRLQPGAFPAWHHPRCNGPLGRWHQRTQSRSTIKRPAQFADGSISRVCVRGGRPSAARARVAEGTRVSPPRRVRFMVWHCVDLRCAGRERACVTGTAACV